MDNQIQNSEGLRKTNSLDKSSTENTETSSAELRRNLISQVLNFSYESINNILLFTNECTKGISEESTFNYTNIYQTCLKYIENIETCLEDNKNNFIKNMHRFSPGKDLENISQKLEVLQKIYPKQELEESYPFTLSSFTKSYFKTFDKVKYLEPSFEEALGPESLLLFKIIFVFLGRSLSSSNEKFIKKIRKFFTSLFADSKSELPSSRIMKTFLKFSFSNKTVDEVELIVSEKDLRAFKTSFNSQISIIVNPLFLAVKEAINYSGISENSPLFRRFIRLNHKREVLSKSLN